MTLIPASWDTLLSQASDTTETYLSRAVRMLDEQFGEGYARENPHLVGQLVLASAADFASASFGKVVGELNDTIASIDFFRDG